jgi:hypothetical protein
MKNKIDVQEKGGRVLSTSTCENIKHVKVIFKVYISDTLVSISLQTIDLFTSTTT